MKTRVIGILLAIMMLTGVSTASAEPQRIQIKDPAKTAKEKAAKARIKNIDLRDIEDPATQDALQEILNYLGLKSKG